MNINAFKTGTDNSVMIIKFMISDWCNYSCPYCNYSKATTRRKNKYHTGYRNIFKSLFIKNNSHAFDNYSVNSWVGAFEKINTEFILEISGGEPFLDVNNFSKFLEGIAAINKCKLIRIDTNGFWGKIKKYDMSHKVKSKTTLNISYHPTQIGWERYMDNIDGVAQAGWKFIMINYVMTESQKNNYEKVRDSFCNKYGIYVNPNPDKYGDIKQQEKELAKYFPEFDLKYKVSRTSPMGKKCFFPSIAYWLEPTGEIARCCVGNSRLNFIKQSNRLFAIKQSSICPKKKCPCIDMYAFLEKSGRGKKLNLLSEYVEICQKYQSDILKRGNNNQLK